MYPTHKGKAKATVKVRCLDAVKTYGNKPKKLFTVINKKIEIKICVKPWDFIPPKAIENSLFK